MKKKYQKILCLLTASLLLFLSPVSSFMDVANMTQVEAAEVALPAGISAMELLFNLFGATTVGSAALDKASTFKKYIDIITQLGYAGVAEILSNLTTGESLTITKDMTDATKAYLEQEVGNPASGKIQYTYDGYYYENGDLTVGHLPQILDMFKKDSRFVNSDGSYFFVAGSNPTSYNDKNYCLYVNSSSYVLGTTYNQAKYFVRLSLNDYGYVQYSSYTLDSFYLANGSASNLYTFYTRSSLDYTPAICTNVPYIECSGIAPESVKNMSLQDILDKAIVRPAQSISMASWGAYNEKLLEKLIDKVISAKAIGNLNTSVSDVITANTVTDEATGDITYTDNIADVVQAAVKKALDDAGIDGWEVIEGGGGTTENPDPGENEDAKYPWLPDLSNKIGSVEETFNNGLKSIADAIASGFNTLWGWQKNILEAIQTGFIQLWDWLGKILDAIKAIPENAKELWKANAPILWEWLGKIGDYIQAIPGAVADFWADFQPTLWKWLSDIKDAIFLIPAAIGEIIGDIADLISPLWDTLFQWLGKILNAITSLPQTIADLILSGLEKLFVPDLADVQPELEVINSKFGWMGNLYAAFKTNLTTLNPDAEPPVIYIDFTKSESSKYVPVGKQLAIDFSWYAKYKPAGDKIISAFMWIGYLWFTFKRLPDIISGGGAVRVDELRYEDAMEKKAKREAKAQKKGGRP